MPGLLFPFSNCASVLKLILVGIVVYVPLLARRRMGKTTNRHRLREVLTKSPLGVLARMALADAGTEDVDEAIPKSTVFSKGTCKVHPLLSELVKRKRESQAAALVHPSPAGYVYSIKSHIHLIGWCHQRRETRGSGCKGHEQG